MSNLFEKLQEKLSGHPYSGYFSCCCPFLHNGRYEENPSFFVYEDGYRCASCGKHGSLVHLNKFLGGHSVKISRSKPVLLPRWSSWEQKYGDLEGIAKHAHLSLKRYPQWNFYFKQRKIEQFTEQGYFGYLDGWALFPVFDQTHKIENIVVRSTKKDAGARYVIKPTEEKKPLLYCPNWQRVKDAEAVYVVYGIIDAISLELIGLPVVTGITGKSLSVGLLKPLDKQFIIVPDEQEEREAHRLANSLGWRATVKRLCYQDDVKDPDGIRTHFGNDYLLQALGA